MVMRKFSSEKLRMILEDKNISQVTIADKLEVSPSTVCNWVKGKTIPDIDNLNSISEILNITVDELMDDVGQSNFSGSHNNANNANIIYNSQVTINPSESKSDFTFTDNKSDKTLDVTLSIKKEFISKIVSSAIQENMLPAKYINDLLEKHFK